MRVDPIYGEITRRWLDHPEELNEAFAKAWYKLLHRDMGPISRYLGPWVPEPQLWQDPVPAVERELIDEADIAALKAKVLDSGLSVPQLVKTAWSSAASFRSTDKRGGANGARIRLEPQKNWEANEPVGAGEGAAGARADPAGLQRSARRQEGVAGRSDRAGGLRGGREGGQGRRLRGHGARSRPGRTDATQENTDVDSFAVLEPRADGFRNYVRPGEKAAAGAAAARAGVHAGSDGSGADGAGRRSACARRQPRRQQARRVHRHGRAR